MGGLSSKGELAYLKWLAEKLIRQAAEKPGTRRSSRCGDDKGMPTGQFEEVAFSATFALFLRKRPHWR